jgi:hypothetical protein
VTAALDPAREAFTIAISKGSGLVRESRTLLEAYQPGESIDDLARRVSDQDLLGRATEQRTQDLVRRVFAKRFLEPTPQPGERLKRLLNARPYGRWFPELCLLYACRADATLRGVVEDVYAPAVQLGGRVFTTSSVEAYLRDAEVAGRTLKPWSPEVRRKVARGIAQAMEEFGLLDEISRGHREIRLPDPHPVTIAYLAYDIRDAGASDAEVVSHRDWRLWAQESADVRFRLDALTSYGLWVFQAAGSVTQITWSHANLDEALDAIARLDVR